MRRRFLAETGHWAHPRDFSPHPSPHTGIKKEPYGPFSNSCGERCRELIDEVDGITRRLYNMIDWMFEHPEYNPKTKVIPKKDYPVLVDVTF